LGRVVARIGALAVIGVLALGACSSGPVNTPEGRWRDAHQNIYEFKAAGSGAFTGEIIQGDTDVCLPAHIKVTGGNGRYSGSEAYQTVVGGKCTGTSAGTGGIGLTVAADGKTVAVTHTAPGAVGTCTNCQPETWTKVPAAGGVPWLLILIVVLVLLLAAGAYAVFWRRRHSRRPPPPGASGIVLPPPPDHRFSAPPTMPTSGSSG
jgi:hypothetical protein